MFKRVLLALLPVAIILSSACQAAQNEQVFATQQGTWITIYMNDFVGMKFAGGLSKAEACVSEAKRKVGEFMAQGMSVDRRLLMEEMAAFEVQGRDTFMVYCNANSALVVDMLLSGSSAEAMARRENAGTAARSDTIEPARTETEIDLKTGKAKSVTTVPVQ